MNIGLTLTMDEIKALWKANDPEGEVWSKPEEMEPRDLGNIILDMIQGKLQDF